MQIELSFDEHEPPSGSVAADGRGPVPFTGWLGLLRLLEELKADPAAAPAVGSALTFGVAGGHEPKP